MSSDHLAASGEGCSGWYVGCPRQGCDLDFEVEEGPKGPQARDVSVVTPV